LTARPLAILACSLLTLVVAAPGAAADLTVDTRPGQTYSIYTHGSSTLAAPQNTSIAPAWGGYVIDWQPPTSLAGQEVTGYTLYRIPGPVTGGDIQVTRLPARWTVTYDRPGDGTYVYLVTAVFANSAESVPGAPLSTRDTNYPHCNVVGIYPSPPYYDTHYDCLFPLP
jgi:hypothetical protein